MIENQTVKERLLTFIKYLGIGQAKFERECGLSNGYVNNIRVSIQPAKLQSIAQQYPELNPGWLMTGEGEMLRSDNIQMIGNVSSGSTLQGVNVRGSDIHINPNAYDTLLKIVEANQETTRVFQSQTDKLIVLLQTQTEQTNRLVSVIEKMNDK